MQENIEKYCSNNQDEVISKFLNSTSFTFEKFKSSELFNQYYSSRSNTLIEYYFSYRLVIFFLIIGILVILSWIILMVLKLNIEKINKIPYITNKYQYLLLVGFYLLLFSCPIVLIIISFSYKK